MKIKKIKQGVILEVYVKPRSNEFKIKAEGDEIVVFCREEPAKGKVNKELIKELSRLFHRNVELVSGFTSKQKRLLIKNAGKSEVQHILLCK
ncbi:YggU family protein [Candidatus Bathyarchaeota archaeon]|nr:YggU family protein [Candidatus Bathyarchaeota archaeon]